MMDFRADELSIEEIDKKVASLNSEIINSENEFNTSYSLETLSLMQESEIRQILEKYGLGHRFNELNEYYSVLFLYKDETIYSQFSKTLNPIREKAINVILEINNSISRRLNEIRRHNEEIYKQIQFYDTLKKYLTGDFSYTKEEYDELSTFVLQSDIAPDQKVILSLALSKNLIEMKQTKIIEAPIVTVEEERTYTANEIDSFEEDLIGNEENIVQTELEESISQFRREQIEFANAKYEQYKTFIAGSSFGDLEEISGIFTLEDVVNDDYSIEMFAIVLNVSVSSIKKLSLSDEEIQVYIDILKNIDERYIKTINYEANLNEEKQRKVKEEKIISNINSKIELNSDRLKKLFESSSTLGTVLGQDFYDSLVAVQPRMEIVRKEAEKLKIGSLDNFEKIEIELDSIEKVLDELNRIINEKMSEENSLKPTEIKTFILFDTDEQSKKTFLYEDLLGNNPFIDMNAIIGNDVSEEDKNYQQNISKLIRDLMVYGKSEYMLSVNSSAENYGDKIESIIYKKDKNGNVQRDEKTPLWRIRPTKTSNIRFIERKVIIPQNSELLHQVKEIIQKYLPKVIIPDDQDFTMMINLGCGIKRADEELYTTAYRRFKERNVVPLALFYENGNYGKQYQKATKLKTRLSEEDCQVLEAYVVTSLQSLYEMSKTEPLYNFDFIDRMGGEKKYGLQ